MLGKLLLHLEVLEDLVAGQDFLQQFPEAGDVPLAFPQLIDETVFRLLGGSLEDPVKGIVGRDHPEVAVQDHQGLPHGGDDGLGIVPGLFDLLQAPLQEVHIHQGQHDAVDALLSMVRYGRIRREYQRPSRSRTSTSLTQVVQDLGGSAASRSRPPPAA